jgi:mono/diheme cytochrome c family protein
MGYPARSLPMSKAREAVTQVRHASFGRVKGIMKIAYLKRIGTAIGVVSMLTLVFLVSGIAQTEVKYTDAASYYKDGKCVVCHGQKAEKKFNAELKDEELLEIVMKGKKPEKPPNMPAYEAKGITAEQAKAMIAYMKQLKAAQ